MSRNKYIYCLSDAAIVVKSDTKGGTWNGAEENRKYWRVPLWVRKSDHVGNRRLVEKGAEWLSNDIDKIDIGSLTMIADTLIETAEVDAQPKQGELFGAAV